jgi:hypothetical protein
MNLIAMLTNARKKMEKMLDDLNAALPTMKALGLSVTDVDVKMGLLPSVSATLRGSFKDMDPKKIVHLREGSRDNQVLMAILRALETAANVRSLVRAVVVEGIEVRVKLGLNFSVDVKFVTPETLMASPELAAAAS